MQRSLSAPAFFDVIDAVVELQLAATQFQEETSDFQSLRSQHPDRITEADLLRLWQILDQYSRVKTYGLLIGQRIAPGTKGLLASWISQCDNLGEALTIFVRHIRLMSEVESIVCRRCKDTVEIEHSLLGLKAYPLAFSERSLSAFVTWASHLSQRRIIPKSACFSWSRPPHWRVYVPLFGNHMSFGAKRTILHFDTRLLNYPVTSANQFLKTQLSQQALNTIQTLDATTSLGMRVSHEITKRLNDPMLGMDNLSKQFGMSRQTLYRRLKSEGHTFSELYDTVRKQRAEALMWQPGMTVEVMGALLGFQDASACHKAYRRWFGMSFTEFRIGGHRKSSTTLLNLR